MRKYFSEFIGTFILVLFGCGVAVFTNGNVVCTALAFGLSLIAIYYMIGSISGSHVNPAVSFSLFLNKKISGKEFLFYVISQILGAIFGALVLAIIINNASRFGDYKLSGLGENSFGDHITMLGAFIVEVILTFVFILTVLSATKDPKKSNNAGFVIGLSLTLVHLFGISLTGTSVNPARSLAPALFLGGEALSQVWVFVLSPMVGSAIAAFVFKFMNR